MVFVKQRLELEEVLHLDVFLGVGPELVPLVAGGAPRHGVHAHGRHHLNQLGSYNHSLAMIWLIRIPCACVNARHGGLFVRF